MVLAILVSVLLVGSAPFIGELRRWVANTLPGQYIWIVNGAVALAGAAVVVAAARRIRDGWMWRLGLIAVAVVTAVVFTRLTGSDNPAVAAVEHFHFVQYGVITGLFYRACRPRADVTSLVWPIAAATIFGTAEEAWQWFLPARVGELADVILNLVAIGCGWLVSIALAPLPTTFRTALTRGWLSATGAIACAILTIAAFAYVVHVGHRHEGDGIGVWWSRYSMEELQATAAARAAQWATDPPLVRKTLAREDQFRSEGEAHVRARNTAWDAGDVSTAWKENLILERYYAPVLDTPSHISKTGHRWHPDHRTDAERRFKALVTPPPFESRAVVDTKWTLSGHR